VPQQQQLQEIGRNVLSFVPELLGKQIAGFFIVIVTGNFVAPCVFIAAKIAAGDFQTFMLILSLIVDAQAAYDNYTSYLTSYADCRRAQQIISHFLNGGGMGQSAHQPTFSSSKSTLEIGVEMKGKIGVDPVLENGSGIVLNQVELGYEVFEEGNGTEDGSTVLKKVVEANAVFPPASVVGIIGESGCGKSTLLRALTGMMNPLRGEISVNGKPIHHDVEFWRSQISVIPQDCYLFNRKIVENITFGNPNAQESDVIQASERALVDKFATKLPQRLNTMVETGGKNLSGGQKQRIHIARAVLKQSKYLFFDEPVIVI
jgi:ABC-type multidrug transport system fused ATPase/permease subunit